MNPNTKFKSWLRIAKNKYEFDATAFALSTCENNVPSVRMVLLKKLLPDGLVFFTNLNSKKGQHFKKNKNLSMCFYWESLQKQVRISGEGVIIKDKESDEYFSSRSRGSQIGAWASKQSNEIKKRDTLIKKFNCLTKKYENKPVPRRSDNRPVDKRKCSEDLLTEYALRLIGYTQEDAENYTGPFGQVLFELLDPDFFVVHGSNFVKPILPSGLSEENKPPFKIEVKKCLYSLKKYLFEIGDS